MTVLTVGDLRTLSKVFAAELGRPANQADVSVEEVVQIALLGPLAVVSDITLQEAQDLGGSTPLPPSCVRVAQRVADLLPLLSG